MDIKQELVEMLNQALRLEYRARIQYLSHAESIKGQNAEKIIERLKEIAADELEHEKKFRELIGGYLGGEPVMTMEPAEAAGELKDILAVNLKQEKEAIDLYKKIYRKALDSREQLQYEFEVIEHELRHVIMDEEEHVSELSLIMGK